MNDGDSTRVLARWTDRFLAWLVDAIIVYVIFTSLVSLPLTSSQSLITGDWFDVFEVWDLFESSVMGHIQQALISVAFFAYWTVLEYRTGQSIGKKILNLRIARVDGSDPSLSDVLISSFGKSFLLPVDVVVGWILTGEKRQRVFNRLSDTVIIKIRKPEDDSGIRYIKD